ncbi:hypothetical protein GCM10022251_62330 [Phytohabitans flavus]|uniref:Uncharacterized protein n=1 Tax=Phytohabitans flavus TaxID=1076124 RepID=A0A6F8Y5H3_9ACTN|nr:DUF5615 family PIN-like protein [Phytohabitans flavus]BCB81279.1 hypothetical protein Pflav_076890 [Phytohabitans flavus]
MLILLDEDVPHQVIDVLQHVLRQHQVDHIHGIGWSKKKDHFVYKDAKQAGYDVIVTNDDHQMSDPDECRDVRKSGLHRVSYKHRGKGLPGLALATASIIAAMPDIIVELEKTEGQRLVEITQIDARHRRYTITDPNRNPPKYWR